MRYIIRIVSILAVLLAAAACLLIFLIRIAVCFETDCLSCLAQHGFSGFHNFRAFNILVESHELIDDAAGGDFDNPICHGIHELVVMGGKKNHILEVSKAVI